jgi:hypothetical protein
VNLRKGARYRQCPGIARSWDLLEGNDLMSPDIRRIDLEQLTGRLATPIPADTYFRVMYGVLNQCSEIYKYDLPEDAQELLKDSLAVIARTVSSWNPAVRAEAQMLFERWSEYIANDEESLSGGQDNVYIITASVAGEIADGPGGPGAGPRKRSGSAGRLSRPFTNHPGRIGPADRPDDYVFIEPDDPYGRMLISLTGRISQEKWQLLDSTDLSGMRDLLFGSLEGLDDYLEMDG